MRVAVRPDGSPTWPVNPPTTSTAVCPRSWNCRSLRSTTACPSVRLVPGGIDAELDPQRPLLPPRGEQAARPGRPRAGSVRRPTRAPRRRRAGQRAGRRRPSVTPVSLPVAPRHARRPPGRNADTDGCIGEPEPPGLFDRDADADPRAVCGAAQPRAGMRFEPTVRGGSHRSTPFVARSSPRQLANRAGPLASSRVAARRRAPRSSRAAALDDLAGPQQHRRRHARPRRRRCSRTSACRR